ncbi:MAG: response regulator transcription factor [Alcanivoracaceae bacterium]|jgi:DNA-binding response OmpR family regulator|nr:response regulator transcription factor [Alcanivoracaceae bacterium]
MLMEQPEAAHILVLEDDDSLRGVLKDFLSLMGYRVTEARDIAEYRAQATSQDIDLTLLDLNLPDGDGLTLVRELASQSGAPVFVVSGRCDEGSRLQALEAGADDYLIKPFNARELEYRIRNFLRRQRQRDTGELREQRDAVAVGNWKLFTGQYRLTSPTGEVINLTRSERDLLQVLVEAEGNLCTRRQLARAISSPTETTSEETVTVLIYRLRRKLEQSGLSGSAIETVTGAGYRLVQAE